MELRRNPGEGRVRGLGVGGCDPKIEVYVN